MRLVGKVVKWGVVAAVLLLIMGGILAAVGVGEAAESSQKGTQRAAVAYGQLRKGMSAAHVQQLVGKPEDTAAYHEFGGRTVCWYYGTAAGGRQFEFCFRRWRLISKSHVG